MSRILLDMDGVVADLTTPWLARYNRDYNDSLTSEDLKAWDVHQFVKSECGTKIYDYLNQRGAFADLVPLPGAVDCVDLLLDAGHEVYFVTTPPTRSPWAVLEKSQWVEEFFPRVGAGNMVFTRHKHLVRGDFLIDDYEKNLHLFDGHCILFDQPWNRSVDTQELAFRRGFDWRHVFTMIAGLS